MSYSSDDSCSNEGGAMRGFGWGNIDDRGDLDQQERHRYPREFRDNIESQQISDVSMKVEESVWSASSNDNIKHSHLLNVASLKSQTQQILTHEEQLLAKKIRQQSSMMLDSDSDELDFDSDKADDANDNKHADDDDDDDDDVNDLLAPIPEGRRKQSDTAHTTSSRVKVPLLRVLRNDIDGSAVLKFTDLYSNCIYNVGFKLRHEITPPRKAICVTMLSDEIALNAAPPSPSAADIAQTAAATVAHTVINDDSADTLAAWKQYPCATPLLAEHEHVARLQMPLNARLDNASFSLLEQLSWEEDIVWDDNDDDDDVTHHHHHHHHEADTMCESVPVQSHTTSPVNVDTMLLDEDDVITRDSSELSCSNMLPLQLKRKPICVSIKPHSRRRRPQQQQQQRAVKMMISSPALSAVSEVEWGNINDEKALNVPPDITSDMLLSPTRNVAFNAMRWLDTVVWDDERMPQCQADTRLILDANDPNMLLSATNVIASSSSSSSSSREHTVEGVVENLFNLSYDQSPLYRRAGDVMNTIVGKAAVQHAMFAQQLDRNAFPTHYSKEDLRYFHRPRAHLSSSTSVRLSTKERSSTRRTAAGVYRSYDDNNMAELDARKHVPKKLNDVTGRYGRIILLEHIEERPPLLAQIGMASELITYYRRAAPAIQTDPGAELVAASRPPDGSLQTLSFDGHDRSPFIGRVRAGRMVSAVENNLYVAPMFEHTVCNTDFLLTGSRSRTAWYVREIPALYVLGQVQPRVDVKAPNSRAANQLLKEMMSAYIFRMLHHHPKLLISDVVDAFPKQSETSIRSKLKEVAEFQRGGCESGWWKHKAGARIKNETEIREMVTPEQMCLYACMLAGEQRLDDVGIDAIQQSTTQLSSFISRIASSSCIKPLACYIDTELQLTPWNLTANYLAALQGRFLLKLNGPGNPLGRGQGFSYTKAQHRLEVDPAQPKIAPAKALTGTDKDLRKLNMNELRDNLLSFGLQQAHIDSLTRWQQVGKLRTLCSEATLNGESTQLGRFARQQRNTNRVQQIQFLKEAHKVFERQCDVLSTRSAPEASQSDDEMMEDFARGLEDVMAGDDGKRAHTTPSSSATTAAATAAATVNDGEYEPSSSISADVHDRAELERWSKERRQASLVCDEGRIATSVATVADTTPIACVISTPAPVAVARASTPGRQQHPQQQQQQRRRRRVKRRVVLQKITSSNSCGEDVTRVVRVTKPELVNAFDASCEDGGKRFQELLHDSTLHVEQQRNSEHHAGEQTAASDVVAERRKVFRKRGELKKKKRRRKLVPGAALSHSATHRDTRALSPTSSSSLQRHTSLTNATRRTASSSSSSRSRHRTPVLGVNGKPMIKCGACGEYGHTKSNRKCRAHAESRMLAGTSGKTIKLGSLSTTPSRHHHRRRRRRTSPSPSTSVCIRSPATLVMSSAEGAAPRVVRHTAASAIKGATPPPTRTTRVKRRRSSMAFDDGDEYAPHGSSSIDEDGVLDDNDARSVSRRRASFRVRGDPRVKLNSLFERAIDAMLRVPSSGFFLHAVSEDIAPGYTSCVATPMYIQLLKGKVRDAQYTRLTEFCNDVQLLVTNSTLFNGAAHPVTLTARAVVQAALDELARNNEELMSVESEVAASTERHRQWTLMKAALDELWAQQDAALFRFRVKRHEIKDYHERIRNPVSLSCMRERLERGEYANVDAFLNDMDLLLANATMYNGETSPVTRQARVLHDMARRKLVISSTPV